MIKKTSGVSYLLPYPSVFVHSFQQSGIFNPPPDEELEEKLLIVATAFAMRWDYAKTLADAAHNNSKPAVELPSSWLLLLWAVHGGCTSMEELRRVAMMMMLIYLSQRDEYSAHADAARHLMFFLRDPTSKNEVKQCPCVRALTSFRNCLRRSRSTTDSVACSKHC